MIKCKHDDCFTCPYPDCIAEKAAREEKSRNRRKLTPDEIKRRKREINKKYYSKNRDRISELHRDYYKKKKKSREGK